MSQNFRFPARPLFQLQAYGMIDNVISNSGPFGESRMSAPNGGTVNGDKFMGSIAPNLANEWQLSSPYNTDLAFIRGLLTLISKTGDAVLMKYVGRRSARYNGEWRIGAIFEAAGESEWLNDVVAAGVARPSGSDLHFSLFELLSRSTPPDEYALECEALYTMTAAGSVGDRFKINSPIGGRYLSVADSGCSTTGQLTAEWPRGFTWGAHRTAPSLGQHLALPFHIDMTVGLIAHNGDVIYQSYIGTNARDLLTPSSTSDGSWRTVAIFEAPKDGPNAYLNEVVALGFGWVDNNEANYEYFCLN